VLSASGNGGREETRTKALARTRERANRDRDRDRADSASFFQRSEVSARIKRDRISRAELQSPRRDAQPTNVLCRYPAAASRSRHREVALSPRSSIASLTEDTARA